ncbi:MAG: acetyl-CoA carboxylase subunit beta [Omnitrophica bacterium GWA2_50_21]|nr:MAG: acetyl-CoA carboxylase subunit beta [Omnitrophica bacterium GWA2_50_21]
MPIFKKENTKAQEADKPAAAERKKRTVPEGLWTKCPSCQHVVYNKALQENFSVCPKCSYHFTVGAWDRIHQLIDKDTFQEFDIGLCTLDPIQFTAVKSYPDKLLQDQRKTGLNEACLTGTGLLQEKPVALGVTDSRFIMGSMGSVVGEKITRLIEYAMEKELPLLIISGSGGGARMYEGVLSLMQMAKTCCALNRFQKLKLPYISVLTNPTMGGVMASFASLGDVIIAEPRALIGFAGPRVIEQTIRQKLPQDFQTSEFLMNHGMIDLVVNRKDLQNVIANVLDYLH